MDEALGLGLERQADGSVLDLGSGYTLEQCEVCGDYYPPEDEGYSGLCFDCDPNPDRQELSLYPS